MNNIPYEFFLVNNNGMKLNILEGREIIEPKAIVINIHGLGGNFQPMTPYRCFDTFYYRDQLFYNHNIKSYALEFQGHGKSMGSRCLVDNIYDLVEDINILIKYLNIKYYFIKKYIIAESMGGNIAIRYCIKYNNIAGLVLLNPMCGLSEEMIPNCCALKLLLPLSYIFPCLPLIDNSNLDSSIHNKNFNIYKKKSIYYHSGDLPLATGRECYNATKTIFNIADKFIIPIIAFHSIDDTITSANMTKSFIDQCNSTNKQFIPIKNSHHSLLINNDKKTNNPEEILNNIINWITGLSIISQYQENIDYFMYN